MDGHLNSVSNLDSVSNPGSTKISRQKILAALAMEGVELGVCPEFSQIRPQFDIHLFETLPSTNTHLWQMLGADTQTSSQTRAKAGTVVVARQQSAGRGQRDHRWQSEPGGLYLSLALEPDWPVTRSAQLTSFSAWGIATALGNLGIPIQIKWPNDLFYSGKKLGGILTETKLSQSGVALPSPESETYIKQAVIGVGLNWHNLVPQTGTTLTKILGSGLYDRAKTKVNCLETLIVVVLRGILQGYFYQQRVGSQVFMKTYGKLLTQVGKTVSVEKGMIVSSLTTDLNSSLSSRCSGRVVGISEEGYLEVALQQSDQKNAQQNAQKSIQSAPVLQLRPNEIRI